MMLKCYETAHYFIFIFILLAFKNPELYYLEISMAAGTLSNFHGFRDLRIFFFLMFINFLPVWIWFKACLRTGLQTVVPEKRKMIFLKGLRVLGI